MNYIEFAAKLKKTIVFVPKGRTREGIMKAVIKIASKEGLDLTKGQMEKWQNFAAVLRSRYKTRAKIEELYRRARILTNKESKPSQKDLPKTVEVPKATPKSDYKSPSIFDQKSVKIGDSTLVMSSFQRYLCDRLASK
jgi:hypothetical protein